MVQGKLQSLDIQLPANAPAGLAWLEVQRGALLSPARPLLVVSEPDLAAECMCLLTTQPALESSGGQACFGSDAMAVDLGLVLRAHYCGWPAWGLASDLVAAISSRWAIVLHHAHKLAQQLLLQHVCTCIYILLRFRIRC